jgi:hypothetical protein
MIAFSQYAFGYDTGSFAIDFHFGSVQSKFSSGSNDCGFPRNCEASTVGIIDPFDTPLASLLGSTSSGTAESAKT